MKILESLDVFHRQTHRAVTTNDQVGLGKGILTVSVAYDVTAIKLTSEACEPYRAFIFDPFVYGK